MMPRTPSQRHNDDELPFDELDPCCQKEIESDRRRTAVSRELRKTDRSNVRHDLVRTVFGGALGKAGLCGCCSQPSVDYPLLAQLRQRLSLLGGHTTGGGDDGDRPHGADDNDDDEDDDDDDSYADLLNELTPFEEERLQQAAAAAARVEQATGRGFGAHVEDSVGHVETLLAQGAPLVCHLFNPTLTASAVLDCALEGLARKYLGTRFRRVELSSAAQPFRDKWRLEDRGNAWQPCLAVFVRGQLVASTCTLERFAGDSDGDGDGSDVLLAAERLRLCASEMEKFLDNARALDEDLTLSALRAATDGVGGGGNDNDDDDDVPDQQSYCGLAGCGRNFPHEHVDGGAGGARTLTGAVASDALAKDYFLKV